MSGASQARARSSRKVREDVDRCDGVQAELIEDEDGSESTSRLRPPSNLSKGVTPDPRMGPAAGDDAAELVVDEAKREFRLMTGVGFPNTVGLWMTSEGGATITLRARGTEAEPKEKKVDIFVEM